MKAIIYTICGLMIAIGLIMIAAIYLPAPCDQQCRVQVKIDRLVQNQQRDCMELQEDGTTLIRQDCMTAYEDQIATLSTQGD